MTKDHYIPKAHQRHFTCFKCLNKTCYHSEEGLVVVLKEESLSFYKTQIKDKGYKKGLNSNLFLPVSNLNLEDHFAYNFDARYPRIAKFAYHVKKVFETKSQILNPGISFAMRWEIYKYGVMSFFRFPGLFEPKYRESNTKAIIDFLTATYDYPMEALESMPITLRFSPIPESNTALSYSFPLAANVITFEEETTVIFLPLIPGLVCAMLLKTSDTNSSILLAATEKELEAKYYETLKGRFKGDYMKNNLIKNEFLFHPHSNKNDIVNLLTNKNLKIFDNTM